MSKVYRTNLASGQISGELKAMPDYVMYQKTVAADFTSDKFAVGGARGQIELVGIVTTDVVIASGGAIVLNATFADDPDGSYVDTTQLYSNAVAGTVSAGTELFRLLVPTDKALWGKVAIDITGTVSGNISVYPVAVRQ